MGENKASVARAKVGRAMVPVAKRLRSHALHWAKTGFE